MNECVAADKAAHMYEHRFSGALRIFFFKLCKFLRKAPVIVIFVFDGPDRPSFKHGRKINTQTIPEWSQWCKSIIKSFGFYWLQVPGEAEAELALLSCNNAIDVILTSDSDSLVFGAGRVLKSVARSEIYEVYNMDVIKDNHNVGLSRGGLILIAVLSGGDYSDGLDGCGSTTSAALARCGFGDRLLKAFDKLESIKLDKELEIIARDIEAELRYNTSGFLTARNPKLASEFSVEHIAPDKVSAYLYPVVSASSTSNLPNWIAREPNVPQISKFCAQTLNWAPNDLEKKLQNILWPGVFLRIITSVSTLLNSACITVDLTEIL
ncbi:PIN domain-like protein [Flammula alnicola]|nr:PIN domain-like protein [Flammula alnicola]